MNKQNTVLYPELSYEIMGAAMDVHNQLGPGWDEETYHVALFNALKTRGLRVESKIRGILKNHNIVADTFELDLLVEDKIVLELKHLLGRFDPAHYIQLINYLKFWKKDLGILINFGMDRLHYERLPFTPRTDILKCTGAHKNLGETETIRAIFSEILNQHGLGYGTNVYKKLFQSECLFQNIQCARPKISLSYESVSLGTKEVDAFFTDSYALVSISAMGENTSAVQLSRMLSYMHQTGISPGILANFGKNELELKYVTP